MQLYESGRVGQSVLTTPPTVAGASPLLCPCVDPMATSGYLSRICWDGKFNVATHRSDSTAEPGVWEGIVRGEAFCVLVCRCLRG